MLVFAPLLVTLGGLLSLSAVDAKSHVKIKLTVPTLVQCQPATLHWKGGKPPFKIWAQSDSRKPEGISAIADNSTDHHATWLVDAPAGSRVKLRLVDAIGHWTNSYSEVHIGPISDCLNPAYPDPTAPASHPPPAAWQWFGGHAVSVLVGIAVLGACVAIALLIGGREKKAEEKNARGEYLPVSGQDIQLSRVGGSVTRRMTPTHELGEDEDGDEEYHNLIQKRRH